MTWREATNISIPTWGLSFTKSEVADDPCVGVGRYVSGI
jgi:hypothetical protein